MADDSEVARLPGFGNHAYFLKFSPNGKLLAALYHGGQNVVIWDVGRGQEVVRPPIWGEMDFSSDSRFAAVPNHKIMQIYDLGSGKQVQQLALSEAMHVVAFNPDGKALAVASPERPYVQVFDLKTGEVTRTITQAGDPTRLRWSPDGVFLARAELKQIYIWDTRTWSKPTVLNTPSMNTASIEFNHQGNLLASRGWDDTVRLWDPRTGQLLFSTHGGNDHVDVQFSLDDRLLAATQDGFRIQLWEVASGRECCLLHNGQRTLGAEFERDARILACACGDGAHLWDLTAARQIAILPTGNCGNVFYSADGNSLIMCSGGGLLSWPIEPSPGVPRQDLRIGPPRRLFDSRFPGVDCDACLSADGHRIAFTAPSSSAGFLGVLDVQDRSEPVLLPGHDNVACIAMSPDGRWVAGGTNLALLELHRVADTRTKETVVTLPIHTRSSFSPDGKWLVTGDDECRLWEVGSWRLDKVMPRQAGLGKVMHGAFSPDGKLLAIAYASNVVRLVNPSSGHELATLAAPYAQTIIRISFSPDGSLLAGVVEPSGVQLWNLRLIRKELAEMGLDWEAPPYLPSSNEGVTEPLRVEVVLGEKADAEKKGKPDRK